jgi:fructose-bisphosphate aldolase class I
MLKLTLPEQDDLYLDLIRHPKVVRVVALSGGYSQQDADQRLRRDHGIVASFFAGAARRALGSAIRR